MPLYPAVRVELGREPQGPGHADQRRERLPWRVPPPPRPAPYPWRFASLASEWEDFGQCPAPFARNPGTQSSLALLLISVSGLYYLTFVSTIERHFLLSSST
jgi:hypothetical protein